MKSIAVIVSNEGTITIDAIGFRGADCEQATKFLEEALGTKVHGDRKPEYHACRHVKQPLHQKGAQ